MLHMIVRTAKFLFVTLFASELALVSEPVIACQMAALTMKLALAILTHNH